MLRGPDETLLGIASFGTPPDFSGFALIGYNKVYNKNADFSRPPA